MDNEKEVIAGYTVEHSIFIGSRRILFGIDHSKEEPFLVCCRAYDLHTPGGAIISNDYLEAMQIFNARVQEQIEMVRKEQTKWDFDRTPFTMEHCIPDDKGASIVGKVVVLNVQNNRYEYRHSAYQLILAEGGFGAEARRGQAVFGKLLADGSAGRWERFDVLGEIKPEHMPTWAKDGLAKIQQPEKQKKNHNREER